MDAITRTCRMWQRRLRLADWKIEVSLIPEEEMPDALGAVSRDETEKRASIALQDGEAETVEATLVHELLHIWLLPWANGDDEEPDHLIREQGINIMADVLINAWPKRKERIK